MRKALSLILTVALLLTLAVCNNVTGDAPPRSEPLGNAIEPNASLGTAAPSDPTPPDQPQTGQMAELNTMYLQIGDRTLAVTLAENSATATLRELLSKNAITIDMRDFGGFEKVGSLGVTLPTSDERITTEPGDLTLFQGHQLVIFYAPNTWSYTRIGRIEDTTQDELIEILGPGNVTVTLSLSNDCAKSLNLV